LNTPGYNSASMRQTATRISSRAALPNLLILVLLVLTVIIVLGQANPLTTAMGRDSGMYTYVASHLLQGKTPYVTAWEHKPPLIFFIDAAALALGGGSRWGIYAIEFVCLLSAALAGFAALRKKFGIGAAAFASVTWLSALGLQLQGGNLTEEYALLFSFLSLWCFTLILESDSLWPHVALGLVFGLGFLTRPNNAGVQFAIVLSEVLLTIFKRRPLGGLLKGLGATGVGFLVPLAAVSLYFLSRNAFTDFIEASFLYNLYYGGRPNFVGSLLSGLQSLGYLAGVALVGLAIAYDGLRVQIQHRAVDAIILWLCLDFIVEMLFSGLSGLNYGHYFLDWLPWMSFAFALLFNSVLPTASEWAAKFPARLALVAIVLVSLASAPTLVAYARSFTNPVMDRELQQQTAVVKYVQANTRPDQTVLGWSGEAAINFLARREAPTAQFQYGILVASDITDRLSAEFYQDLQSRPPALIIDPLRGHVAPLSVRDPVTWSIDHGQYPQPYMQQVFDFIHEHYSQKTTVGGMPIYVLKP
jgi:4-amino-4-deoxy-L-arabinose transferase-like glycosyltransferase